MIVLAVTLGVYLRRGLVNLIIKLIAPCNLVINRTNNNWCQWWNLSILW